MGKMVDLTEDDDLKKEGKLSCCLSNGCAFTYFIVGIVCVILGVCVTTFALPRLEEMKDKQVKEGLDKLSLKKGSAMYNTWISPPSSQAPQVSFYLFNYTNTNDILHNQAKPRVQQIGPYTYREVRINHVTSYTDKVITYLLNTTYVFEKSASCSGCQEDDILQTPSVVMITAMNTVQEMVPASSPVSTLIDVFVNGITQWQLFQSLTVKQLMMTGYHDPHLVAAKTIWSILQKVLVLPDFPYFPMQPLQPSGTVGMKATGNQTFLTGVSSMEDTGRIIKWRGKDCSPFWLTKYGNMINGTDGTRIPPSPIFPLPRSRDYTAYFFVPQLCRSMYATYSTDTTVRGISAYQFTIPSKLFLDATKNPDNAAFCSKNVMMNRTVCWPSGLITLSSCLVNSLPIRGLSLPVFASSPHFYQGDQELVDAIDGVQPNPALHKTYLSFEPITGVAVDGHKRLQTNFMLMRSFLRKTNLGVNKTFNFLPVVYMDEGQKIDQKTADTFAATFAASAEGMSRYHQFKKLCTYLKPTLITVGMLFIVISVTLAVIKKRKNQPRFKGSVRFSGTLEFENPISSSYD